MKSAALTMDIANTLPPSLEMVTAASIQMAPETQDKATQRDALPGYLDVGDALPDTTLLIGFVQRLNKRAACKVSFDTDNRGIPFNIESKCNDLIFEMPARYAVSRARYGPKLSESGGYSEEHGLEISIEVEVNVSSP